MTMRAQSKTAKDDSDADYDAEGNSRRAFPAIARTVTWETRQNGGASAEVYGSDDSAEVERKKSEGFQQKKESKLAISAEHLGSPSAVKFSGTRESASLESVEDHGYHYQKAASSTVGGSAPKKQRVRSLSPSKAQQKSLFNLDGYSLCANPPIRPPLGRIGKDSWAAIYCASSSVEVEQPKHGLWTNRSLFKPQDVALLGTSIKDALFDFLDESYSAQTACFTIMLGKKMSIPVDDHSSNPFGLPSDNPALIRIQTTDLPEGLFKALRVQDFAAIRDVIGINSSEFRDAFQSDIRGGYNRGAAYFYTQCHKFLIKTVTSERKDALLDMLPDYISHLAESTNTYITKFLMLFEIEYNQQVVSFVVVQNPFQTRMKVDEMYELNGSRTDNWVQPNRNTMLTEANFDARAIGATNQQIPEMFKESLARDIDFLQVQGRVGYSALVGIQYIKDDWTVQTGGFDFDDCGCFEATILDDLAGPNCRAHHYKANRCVCYVSIINVLEPVTQPQREWSIWDLLSCQQACTPEEMFSTEDMKYGVRLKRYLENKIRAAERIPEIREQALGEKKQAFLSGAMRFALRQGVREAIRWVIDCGGRMLLEFDGRAALSDMGRVSLHVQVHFDVERGALVFYPIGSNSNQESFVIPGTSIRQIHAVCEDIDHHDENHFDPHSPSLPSGMIDKIRDDYPLHSAHSASSKRCILISEGAHGLVGYCVLVMPSRKQLQLWIDALRVISKYLQATAGMGRERQVGSRDRLEQYFPSKNWAIATSHSNQWDSVADIAGNVFMDVNKPENQELIQTYSKKVDEVVASHGTSQEVKEVYQQFLLAASVNDGLQKVFNKAFPPDSDPAAAPRQFARFLNVIQMENFQVGEVKELLATVFSIHGSPDSTPLPIYYSMFHSFLTSEQNSLMDPGKMEVFQPMDRPLSHYYIASSHNTYLEDNQVYGRSSVEQYVSVLLQGCRCIEIDTWDGSDGEPVVTHGHTGCSVVHLRSVLNVIREWAFYASPYPLIISIEQNCIEPYQMNQVALQIDEIFGELLHKLPFVSSPGQRSGLPDYHDDETYAASMGNLSLLKNKIIIKSYLEQSRDVPVRVQNAYNKLVAIPAEKWSRRDFRLFRKEKSHKIKRSLSHCSNIEEDKHISNKKYSESDMRKWYSYFQFRFNFFNVNQTFFSFDDGLKHHHRSMI